MSSSAADARVLSGAELADPSAAVPALPAQPAPASDPPFPRWLRLADAVHGSAGGPAPALADAALVLGAAVAVGLPAVMALILAGAILVSFDVAGVYVRRSTLEAQGLWWYPARAAVPFALVALGLLAVSGGLGVSSVAGWALAAVGAALVGCRALTWVVLVSARRAGLGLRRALVVGSGPAARGLVAQLLEHPTAGLLPTGPSVRGGAADDGRETSGLRDAVVAGRIAHVVLVPEVFGDVDVAQWLASCEGVDVDVSVRPPLGDLFLRPGAITRVGGVPLVTLGRLSRPWSPRPGKRAFDLLAATVLLVAFAPVMAITALLVKLDDGGPVFFRQRRVGHRGTVFSMLKFRSMVVGAEQLVVSLRDRNSADGLLFKVHDDPRVTRVGRFIRRHSVDELPQLWNVVRGDMSLVGPRPLPVRPEDFGPLDGQRHVVPPGITGYWQTAPGSGLTYREMVRLDLAYVQEWSIWVDLAILARTVPALLRRHRAPDA
ncbi:MAG: sugar transferase [Acidimicrobiales bacterium]